MLLPSTGIECWILQAPDKYTTTWAPPSYALYIMTWHRMCRGLSRFCSVPTKTVLDSATIPSLQTVSSHSPMNQPIILLPSPRSTGYQRSEMNHTQYLRMRGLMFTLSWCWSFWASETLRCVDWKLRFLRRSGHLNPATARNPPGDATREAPVSLKQFRQAVQMNTSCSWSTRYKQRCCTEYPMPHTTSTSAHIKTALLHWISNASHHQHICSY